MVTPPLAKTLATPNPAPTLPTQPFNAAKQPVKDSELVSPALTKPETEPAADPIVEPQTKKSLLALIEEHFVQVDDLTKGGSHFPWRGLCKKCGWHTHQFNREDAFILTRSHAGQHWRDVQRFM
jgi:hypothetical protein